MDRELKKAFYITIPCGISYLMVYIVRNLLSTFSPQMLETGQYTIEYISIISAINMLTYAVGQLVNGMIGDKIKGRYMVGMGLICGGICNILLPFAGSLWFTSLLYGVCGYFCSILYATIVRMIDENLSWKFHNGCMASLMIVSGIGSSGASLMALLFQWNDAFLVCGVLQIAIGCTCFSVLLLLERTGQIIYVKRKKETGTSSCIKGLLEKRIIRFTLATIFTGIVRTTVVFWVPTYLTQYLCFTSQKSITLFSIITIVLVLSSFINLTIYEKVMKRNLYWSIAIMFTAGTFFFLMMILVKQAGWNVFFLLLALVANGGASFMIFSVYCTSLRDTGIVSGVAGYLDFISYIAAAAANLLFSNIVFYVGWGGLIIIWCALMMVGMLLFMPLITKRRL